MGKGKGLINYLRKIYRASSSAYDKEWKDNLYVKSDACGGYRACFIYPHSSIVFKVPLSVRGAICCEDEFRIYEKAKRRGLEMFFARPLKKVEICENVYAYAYEYVKGMQVGDTYLNDYIDMRLGHGRNGGKKQTYDKLLEFLDDYGVRDLHDENWVLTSFRLPKIMDYGWF